MVKAASLIEQQLSDKFPGISVLAKHCSMSPTKFKQEFKRVHGLTPLEYFRTLQIIRISNLSNNREKTVKELAVDMGLKKHSDFSKWYQKVTEQS